MRIAQIAPLWELVPPTTYGGTELVVHNLTEGLVQRGHEVTLFAAEGSKTAAKLHPCAPASLRSMEAQRNKDKTHCTVMGYELMMLETVFEQADRFDVIHNHIGFQALPFANFVDTPTVTTLHNALNPEIIRELFEKNAHQPYISISNYQRQLWPKLNYVATIYHGIQMSRFKPSLDYNNKDYLAFLGRLSPEKGPHLAIQAAKALGYRLILAGKVDRVDQEFYREQVEPLIDGVQIRYIGEVDHERKNELLSGAMATLCPVLWPEPFGLVMIESMACGTPVFALRDGSVPEVVEHGRTGYVAESVEELTEAVRDWKAYNRQIIRKVAEERFSAARMVDDHLKLYRSLLDGTPVETLTPGRIAEIHHAKVQPNQIEPMPSQTFEFTVLEKGHSQSMPIQGYSYGQ
ncbi:MAG TPA: glycosyltransferase family 4 protein [Oculatellaceae cyanobacterium]|jgi:glycosyltransferase involved in cell wall biosynthesis